MLDHLGWWVQQPILAADGAQQAEDRSWLYGLLFQLGEEEKYTCVAHDGKIRSAFEQLRTAINNQAV